MGYKIKLTGRNYLVPVTAEGNPILLKAKNEKQLIAAFTDEKQFAKLRAEGIRPEVFSYDRLKGLVVDDPERLGGIVVNPYGEKIILDQSAIEKIDRATRGMSVKRTRHSGTMRLWQPQEYPSGLVQAMSAYFERQGGIRKVWLFLMQGEGEAKPHWVMILDFDGDRKTVFPVAAETMRPFVKPGESFEIMKAEGTVGEYAREKGRAFYQSEAIKAPSLN